MTTDIETSEELSDLGRVLRPRRPALAEVLACVTGTDAERWDVWLHDESARVAWSDEGVSLVRVFANGSEPRVEGPHPPVLEGPHAAVEALEARGLLPLGFGADARRVFYDQVTCNTCNGRGEEDERELVDVGVGMMERVVDTYPCDACDGRGFHVEGIPHPLRLADVIALAADVEGVLRVEQLARQLAARLGYAGEAIGWRFEPVDAIVEALRPRARAWGLRTAADDTDRGCALGYLAATILNVHDNARRATPYVVRADEMVPCVRATTAALFPLLYDLARSGYAVDAVEPGGIVLFCPELG